MAYGGMPFPGICYPVPDVGNNTQYKMNNVWIIFSTSIHLSP